MSEQYVMYISPDKNNGYPCHPFLPEPKPFKFESPYPEKMFRISEDKNNGYPCHPFLPEPKPFKFESPYPKKMFRISKAYNNGYPYLPFLYPPVYVDKGYEGIDLLDKVRVIARPYGLDDLFPVSKMVIPLSQPENTKYTMGKTQSQSFTAATGSTNSDLFKRVNSIAQGSTGSGEGIPGNGFISLRTDRYVIEINELENYESSNQFLRSVHTYAYTGFTKVIINAVAQNGASIKVCFVGLDSHGEVVTDYVFYKSGDSIPVPSKVMAEWRIIVTFASDAVITPDNISSCEVDYGTYIDEIIASNDIDYTQAQKILKLDRSGLSHSGNGYSGNYTGIIDMDGDINATCIRKGSMSFSRLKGGTIMLGGIDNTDGILTTLDYDASTDSMYQTGELDNEGYISFGKDGSFVKLSHGEILLGDNDEVKTRMSRYGDALYVVTDNLFIAHSQTEEPHECSTKELEVITDVDFENRTVTKQTLKFINGVLCN